MKKVEADRLLDLHGAALGPVFADVLASWRRPVTPRYLTHRVSVECPTFRTLLVALYRHDANTPAQDRGELGIRELLDLTAVADRRIDDLHRLALKAIGASGPFSASAQAPDVAHTPARLPLRPN
jgi:hypothetical protein